ncbi:MAG TPA: tRNA (adenosine(37)-N6)-dimethylallyltransferase MiaA [Candidatus Acidoferrum sp.]|nr:tRNA (adenosine(37)-N6)-dimethylallyltransferase MiaA [Candidatus Acidoferrum sp.]
MSLQPIYIVGPTACGKSDVAIALAAKLGGEIISVDSMQVYRGLDIGSAKPTAAERAQIPHHLIDVVGITEPFDAAKFVQLARVAEADILARGRVPIFCGGTGLYLKVFLDGLGEAPPADPELRKQLEATPLDVLLAELRDRDPITFERIDKQNARRVVRAIEVIRLTGKTFSAQRAEWALKTSANLFGLARPTEELRARIDARVNAMFARGLVAETRELLARGLEQNRTAMQAIGYRQVVEHLRGERSLADAIELVKTKTRQFAKRQLTWFRRQLVVEWMDVPGERSVADIIDDIAARVH